MTFSSNENTPEKLNINSIDDQLVESTESILLPEDFDDASGSAKNLKEEARQPKDFKTDLATLQEQTRSTLAKSLIGLLAATLFGVGIYIWLSKDSKDTEGIKSSRELITLIWTSEVTLVSGALGFYFASNKSN